MNLASYIQYIQIHLIQTHSKVLDWFNETEVIKNYRPIDQGWTVSEILEHIALTSRFLIILIDKGTEKALRNVKELVLEDELSQFSFDLDKLEAIGQHRSFDWIRPEHMEPTGKKSELEIKVELIDQVQHCLNQLARLKHGEGVLHKTTMTVNELGKINVYEYVYFLSKHAERHLRQMEENKLEFKSKK